MVEAFLQQDIDESAGFGDSLQGLAAILEV
jgi:hypothetical protein